MYTINKEIQLSIIIPIYNEADNIKELYFRLVKVLEGLKKAYEIIFVDDGSIDKSFEILNDIYNKNGNVKVIRLTKNFGQMVALLSGFSFARGQIIVTIDADLQCAPEDIPKLLAKINEGFDAVSGFRRFRQDTIFRKSLSYFRNKIMRFKTRVNLKDWGCSLNIISKEVVDQIICYGRNARFIKALGARLGKNITEVEIQHFKRKSGRSKYNILRLILNGLDLLINYSTNLSKNEGETFKVKEILE
jgi:glycosyltransferase involved in cell wall biosynthesis